ncbi:hypothetical protein [Bdellovibrio bacteriovorus]|uniref:hypothetical protein n=1 Tax=Bdellovibrio bacteriovorus TaxID=959 RepID=UPI0035A6DADF
MERPSSNGDCYLSLHNFKQGGLVYRDYLFTKDSLMVFNSFGDGPISQSTGAREYYFFPRKNVIPQFSWNSSDRRLEVTATDGNVVFFDYETTAMTAASNLLAK